MAESDLKTKSYPPIVSFSTVTGFIESLKSTTVPPVIDGSLLTKMSGSVRSSLMSALRFLQMIDRQGITQPRLHELVEYYGTTDWKETLSENFSPAYSEIVEDVDLGKGTANQLYTAFRTKGNVDGQMLEKAVRFYLAFVTETGGTYSPHFKTRSIRTTTKRKPKAKARKQKDQHEEEEDGSPDAGLFGNFDEAIWARFQIPIPDKGDAIIILPKSVNADDWEMVSAMLDAYVKRLTKQNGQTSQQKAEGSDDSTI